MVQIGRASVGPVEDIIHGTRQRAAAKAGVHVAESRARRSCTHFLALQVGFSDILHLNWVFRARFGDTPSGLRARGLPYGRK